MHCKRVCLVINPRAGHNVTRITDLIAVFAAAGWKIAIALKAYPGQAMQLAARAAKQNYDLVIAYGGDGTINKVVNSVINAKGHSIVGVIPGGTANEWAVEIGLPLDPMHAALTLVNSDARAGADIPLWYAARERSAASTSEGQETTQEAGKSAFQRQTSFFIDGRTGQRRRDLTLLVVQ